MVLKKKIALSLVSVILSLSYPGAANTYKVQQNTATSVVAEQKIQPPIIEPATEPENEKWSSKLELIVESEKRIKPYLPLIAEAVEKNDFPISKLDAALVVISVLHAETMNYNRYAISPAAAAGIAQFIPETATLQFGLKTYMPDYMLAARKDLSRAYSHYRNAKSYLEKLDMASAEYEIRAYLRLKKKAKIDFNKYKKDLFGRITDQNGNYLPDKELQKIDERFLPEKGIDACVEFLSHLLFLAEGDIRVAVSGYNAGEGRIKKYKGIPPITETVKYQNKIYNKYKELKKIVNQD